MPKRDVEFFVKSIFKRKQIDDRQRAEKEETPTDFTDFLHQELARKYIHQNRIAEVAYNLLDACKRHSYDADIELFSKVMRGDCSEAVLKQQLKMLREIQTAVAALAVDGETGKPIKGAPTKEQIIQVVREHPNTQFFADSKFETLEEKLDADSPKKGVSRVSFHH